LRLLGDVAGPSFGKEPLPAGCEHENQDIMKFLVDFVKKIDKSQKMCELS
jgi:hypothetical protein